MFKLLLSLLLALSLCLPASCEETSGYLYMINVGKGDAIIVNVSGRAYLIDTGKADAWENVEAALARLGIAELEAVFLTHTDKDHAGGLKKLSKSDIAVGRWYASAFYTCDYDKHKMVDAASRRKQKVCFLQAGDMVDGIFQVLAPSVYSADEDDNSLVMMLVLPGLRALLTGDMEASEEALLLRSGADLKCDIFKVPNHADDDVCKSLDLARLDAKIALISTDPYEKPGTPDSLLLERLKQAGMEIYRTDLSTLGIRVDFGPDGIIASIE